MKILTVFSIPIIVIFTTCGVVIYHVLTAGLEDAHGHMQATSPDDSYKTITQDVDGVKTVYQIFKAPGPLHGKVRDTSQMINGKMRDVLRPTYNANGRVIQTGKEDGDGNHIITTYSEEGKVTGWRFERTKDADVLARLQQREKPLLDALAKATSQDDKNQKLKDLADFYFFTENNVEKAKNYAAQMDDAPAYGLRVQLVFYDHSLTVAEKIKAYEALMVTYPAYKNDPGYKKGLDFQIDLLKKGWAN